MKLRYQNQVSLFLVALSTTVPSIAIAEAIQVRTNNVQATTQNNGSIYVNTGKTSVSIPANRQNPIWDSWRYWLTPWQNHNCRQSSYQQTTQVSSNGEKVVRHSSSSSYCR